MKIYKMPRSFNSQSEISSILLALNKVVPKIIERSSRRSEVNEPFEGTVIAATYFINF